MKLLLNRHLLLSLTCAIALLATGCNEKPKNVILVVVDGMSTSSVTGARLWQGGATHQTSLDTFPSVALVKTHSKNDFVTDSAAAATSLATGFTTDNGFVGLLKGDHNHLYTLADHAKSAGKSVGLITTAMVTNATPAAFYAHVRSYQDEDLIVDYVKTSQLDLLFGGGRSFFFPNSWYDPEEKLQGQRTDGRDIIRELEYEGWTYAQNTVEFDALTPRLAPILGLFSYGHMNYERNRYDDVLGEPSLTEMTTKALGILKEIGKGYFLVVNAARGEHAAAVNLPEEQFIEMAEVETLLKTLLETEKDTLIVVTSDHDTGGMILNGHQNIETAKEKNILEHVNWASGPRADMPVMEERAYRKALAKKKGLVFSRVTAQDVPLYATGPAADQFSGVMHLSDVSNKLFKLLK